MKVIYVGMYDYILLKLVNKYRYPTSLTCVVVAIKARRVAATSSTSTGRCAALLVHIAAIVPHLGQCSMFCSGT